MLITWNCRRCDARLAKLTTRDDDPRVAALTAQAEEDIINTDSEGNLVVRLLCEDCLGAVSEDNSEVHFLRGPQIH